MRPTRPFSPLAEYFIIMSPFKHPHLFRHVMNLWPPFLGAGIQVKYISTDWRKIITQLRFYGLNQNYMGTHFGGSLFAMTDPFYMLMLIKNLGGHFNVWDKAGSIEFVRPAKSKVTATFTLGEKRIEKIWRKAVDGNKHFETFLINVVDKQGEMIAKVNKTIYIRLKQ